MDSLVVPGLDTLRQWLDELGISFFECDSCQALHLPHMQNFEGIFDAKLDLVDNVVLFSALAEVKPSALLPLSADLSAINASSLTVKAFLDIQDDNLRVTRKPVSSSASATMRASGEALSSSPAAASIKNPS